MSVKTVHTDYQGMKSEWEKCSDFMTSAKAVKDRDNGKEYLPVLTDQEPEEYNSYRDRAPCIMFSKRANKAMAGMIGRKEAQIKGVPDQFEFLKNDIDSDGNSLNAYISMVLGKFLQAGRGLTLVDLPDVDSKITVAKAEALGVRPRFYHYDELSMINWRTERINNKDELVLMVLKESTIKMKEDNFSWEVKDQYRVLELVDGTYWVSIYDEDGTLVPESKKAPRMKGSFLKFIPVVIHGGIDVQQPPLIDIVDINVNHYQLSADEMHGLRMAALPTPYFFGKDPKDEDFPNANGPTRCIGAEDTNSKTGFREFTGAGMSAVAAKLKQFADDIAMLSVQMATEQINKSATGSSIDYGNSTATLSGVSAVLSAELTKILKVAVKWAGGEDKDVEIILNMDFMPQGMDANMLAGLLKAYLSGAISYPTFYQNLARGEITDPHKDPEEEKREIDEDLPPGMMFGNEEDDDLDQDDDKGGQE